MAFADGTKCGARQWRLCKTLNLSLSSLRKRKSEVARFRQQADKKASDAISSLRKCYGEWMHKLPSIFEMFE
jgi:hypothetical protein